MGLGIYRLVFFFPENMMFFEDLMQQDQLKSRKADLLIEWGAFFLSFV